MRNSPILILSVLLWLPCSLVRAEERTLTAEEMEALANAGDFSEAEEKERPKNLPDLTKGGSIPGGKAAPPVWFYGPTGIAGQVTGKKFQGDQILVIGTYKGSPAEGKFLPGDVIIGMNGQKFVAGGHMGMLIGKAVMAAELAENGGKISFIVWRDRNLAKRGAKKEMALVDIETLFAQAENDISLYDWKPEKERDEEIRKAKYDEFPIDPVVMEIGLTLRTMPAYADTAPYDCPKTKQILEEAWRVLEKKFEVDPKDPKRSGRGGAIEALALVASGKPEHRKLVHDWVRGPHSPWKPPTEPIGEMFKPNYKGRAGYLSWHKGFVGLDCALYYDATGDDYVLPALKKQAVEVAMGQSWLGSWGHTFAFPSFNGGQLHQMNPGYGALNAAGNRCFFLVTLAQKLGIKDPEIDAAVERARRFFGSYTDQGCIPYGDHGAAGSDDSNGKNTGVAFSMKLLGDNYKAKYFAMMSSHCAFTRRGGHGHDYTGEWSSWAATLCGPEVRIANERNLRWYRTLCRMHDGSFVYNSPSGYKVLRDPTATEVLHQSVIFGQTLLTGKDADKSLYPTEREMKQLMLSARGQFNDPVLFEKVGKPWHERPTDEVIDLLDIFYPKARENIAKEVAQRYQAGEKEVVPKLVALLDSPEPRFREGALRALQACGDEVVLGALSAVIKRIEDPEDFVRIMAIRVVSNATDDKDAQLAMLRATVKEPEAIAPNSVRNATQSVLFGRDHSLANSPFDSGYDPKLVGQALEALIMTDPAGANFLGSRQKVWTEDTVVRLAGPLTYIAEEEQIGDQMFGARSAMAYALLEKFGYVEAAESTIHRMRKKSELPRHVRPYVRFKNAMIFPQAVIANPGAFAGVKDFFKATLIDNPNEEIPVKGKAPFEFDELLAKIESAEVENRPRIADAAEAFFRKEIQALEGSAARVEACRAELADPERRNTFRKLAAMKILIEWNGSKALADLAPYFGSDYWRLRDGSRELAAGLAKSGGAAVLVDLLGKSEDPREKAGILHALAQTGDKSGIEAARNSLKDGSPLVRGAAAHALSTLGGESALAVLTASFAAARDPEELEAFERAFLVGIADSKRAALVRDTLIKALPAMDAAVKSYAWYVLAQLGDPKSIAALKDAAGTDSAKEISDIVMALSYSPSREADRVLLDIAATGEKEAGIVGAQSVRRMVLGPKGYGDITDSERMDFAEPMIKLHMDEKLIKYLGGVRDVRAMRTLLDCLRRGYAGAAESLVSNAENLEDITEAENKLALEVIQNVIEYIEVTHLRGGVQEHMSYQYPVWKALQTRAGKVMLRLHQPEKAPIKGFDRLELER
ncbi:MAG TPA: DUF6288 domain-containing protein [Luteolibacter sp.]|nr:DUF6288 domain-containing protein [Luteolibacter sp.]